MLYDINACIYFYFIITVLFYIYIMYFIQDNKYMIQVIFKDIRNNIVFFYFILDKAVYFSFFWISTFKISLNLIYLINFTYLIFFIKLLKFVF